MSFDDGIGLGAEAPTKVTLHHTPEEARLIYAALDLAEAMLPYYARVVVALNEVKKERSKRDGKEEESQREARMEGGS